MEGLVQIVRPLHDLDHPGVSDAIRVEGAAGQRLH